MQVKLNEIKAGQPFFIGEHKFIVIRQDGAETFVTTADTIREQCFDDNEDNNGDANDFSGSQLKEWLNTEYLATLAQDINPDDILGHAFTLEDDRGGVGYGSCTCKIGLISMKEYEQHKDILKLPRWWWLRTPHAAHSFNARNVHTDGSLDYYYAYYGYIGVRPALYLKSDILVSKKIDLDAPFAQLQGITVEEIKPAPTPKAQRNVQDIIQPLYKHYSNLTELAETHKNNPPVIIPLSVEIRATAELIYRVRYGEVTQ